MINKKNLISLIIAIVLTSIILSIILNIIDWSETWEIIKAVSFEHLIFGCLSILASILVRSFRWWKISAYPKNELHLFIKAAFIGYMGNFLIPFRAGELIRIWVVYKLGKKNAIKITLLSITDRATDFLIISSVMVLIIPFVELPEKLEPIKFFSIIVFIILISATTIGFLYKNSLRIYLNSYSNDGGKIFRFLKKLILNSIEIIETLSKAPISFLFIFFLVALFDMLSIWFVMLSLGWELPLISVALYLVIMSFASILPATPGYIGLYQISAIVTFGLYNIGVNEAFAYSILLQGITAFSYLTFGSFTLLLITPSIIKSYRNS
ncbi:MAG: hypothetical protein CFH01_00550 [Alphaproteobacteria bacterium MarineAlpha2_Bin1]|nr:MAG: hypothetical protein CFH01_00550 [Alphaproteobacteria bacterium MarineAlpha2_Bin1]